MTKETQIFFAHDDTRYRHHSGRMKTWV